MIDTPACDELTLLRSQATALAGRTGDLAQRASVYHHLYLHSGGNHAFPLLAAHGALWASGYFRSGIRFGRMVAGIRGLVGADRASLMNRLHVFAEAFRDINRRVCVETFFIYWLTARRHLRDEAQAVVPAALLEAMDCCHGARRASRSLSDGERRTLFNAFFQWEQAHIVAPSIAQAFAEFDWPLIHALARRPRIRFAYFGGTPLPFRDFSNTAERIEKGLEAFDRAASIGWGEVERSMRDYRIMPSSFHADPVGFFEALVQRLPGGGEVPAFA